MRYQYRAGPRSMAALTYFILGLLLGMPLFESDENLRLERLWYIYMNATYDEQSSFLLLSSALVSLALGIVFFSTYFSDFTIRPKAASVLANASLLLVVTAMFSYSRPIIIAYSFGALCAIWSWRHKNPDDYWFTGST
jgi:hypothetical protein